MLMRVQVTYRHEIRRQNAINELSLDDTRGNGDGRLRAKHLPVVCGFVEHRQVLFMADHLRLDGLRYVVERK